MLLSDNTVIYYLRYHINTSKSILQTILSMQPRDGGQTSGESREAIVYRLAQDMLDKLPQDYVQHEVMGEKLFLYFFLEK